MIREIYITEEKRRERNREEENEVRTEEMGKGKRIVKEVKVERTAIKKKVSEKGREEREREGSLG